MANEDLDALTRDLRDLAAGLAERSRLEKIGLGQERRIRSRTRKGLDYLGDRFAAYSEGHKRRRAKDELPTGKVNLELSLYDGMLTYLSTEVDVAKGTVTVGIFKAEKDEIAGYHNEGAGHNPKREFMGVSDSDTRDIAELMGEQIDDLLSSLDLDT